MSVDGVRNIQVIEDGTKNTGTMTDGEQVYPDSLSPGAQVWAATTFVGGGGGYTFEMLNCGLWFFTGSEAYYDGLDGDGNPGTVTAGDEQTTETFTATYTENGTVKTTTLTVEVIGTTDVCFTRGTMIGTPSGPKPVENLRKGDLVITRDNGLQPIRWVDSTIATASDGKALSRRAPVLIRAHALGPNNPQRDTMVSPLHRVVVQGPEAQMLFDQDEVLVCAKFLVNGTTIVPVRGMREVEYFHILFDTHQVIYADGMLSESFHPGQVGLDAMEPYMRAEILELFPQLQHDEQCYGPAARFSLRQFEGEALARELFGPPIPAAQHIEARA
jgi:hypothetical protein